MGNIVDINGKKVGDGCPAYIIAEVGINHNGNVSLAKEMIQSAWESGADAVKIQTFITREFLHPSHPGYQYDIDSEIPHEKEQEIWDFAKQNEINLFSTPEEFLSLEFIKKQKPNLIKIAAMDFNYKNLIQSVAALDIPIILSSGMSTMEEVLTAKRWIDESKNDNSIFLHCVSCYPAPAHTCNLNAIKIMKSVLDSPVGFSDHTIGIHIPFAAVVMGANVIEKHYTLDKTMHGPDQQASMDSSDLKMLINNVRDFESAQGDGIKKPVSEEEEPRKFKRRGIYAARNLNAGDTLTEDCVVFFAPSSATSKVTDWSRIKGCNLKVRIKKMQVIQLSDVL